MFENKKDNRVFKLPFGLRDIFPFESRERNNIKRIMEREFKLWGYGEVKTPAIEYTKNISIGVGKNWENKLINFFDVDGSPVSLRTDMTIPIARLTGMRIKKSQLPVRFCYFADSFRQSDIQKGVRRVYNQAGLEFIGSSNAVMSDIEILVILINILNGLNIRDYKIGLGHVEFIEGLCDWFKLNPGDREYIRRTVAIKNFVALENFLNKKNKDKAEIFVKLIQPESDIKKISSLISKIKEQKVIKSFNYLKRIYDILERLGCGGYLITDFSIIRDFDYYTGLLFEVYCQNVTDILGSGGRYDGLIKKFGLDIPATGFALDIDLAHKAIEKMDLRERLKILLKGRDNKNNVELIRIARKLRDSDIIVELSFEDISHLEDFAREKDCDLLVEVEPDLENVKITDLNKNIKKVKKTREFIKEFKNEKRN
ncbi:MAG: ATP phosphoribosyltransferase regulatory subunit [Actinobacteria bacterium]|nr:ATP phosphoribosyltransferase regulatory subunit [Actinomycetota bacterium]MBL7124132.1 ATP phosphoribosyltransferase regulatory subunit [Actinomycetota bacterium]